jgi:FixJ family two-component response regulator
VTNDHIVIILDDDERIREALSELLESHGICAVAYGSAREYVRADKPDLPASLILDVELPDINGLDLQKQIADGDHPPIVFITGRSPGAATSHRLCARLSKARWTFSRSHSATMT